MIYTANPGCVARAMSAMSNSDITSQGRNRKPRQGRAIRWTAVARWCKVSAMNVRIQYVCVDTTDPARLAKFWQEALGWRRTADALPPGSGRVITKA